MRSLSWRLTLRVIAILSWLVSIVWLIVEPGFEPLIALLTGVAAFLASIAISPREYKPTLEQRERNRRTMLDLVRNFWIKGVLEPSLHSAAMIELGLERRRDAVERPWDTVLQRPDQPNCPIPRGTRIISVFNAMNKELLILGAPGSGKTTMLLELARDAIARAEQDPTQPIPVVFNLSSWADERKPIADWLVNELNTKYNIPEKIARPWVECDELLLLVDGLDEVALKCRDDCVKAINEFRKDHLVPLVVCSRVADYEAITARLRLQGAILLQPLTPQQIDDYLGGAGAALSAVRETLKHDPALQELAETPLMLSIMTLAYKGVSVADLQTLDTVEARRQHLFDTYVLRMFERRRAHQPHSPRQTIHWLAWLAEKMSTQDQTVFIIEGLQPGWLPAHSRRQVRMFARLVIGLFFGLIGGLFHGFLLGLRYGLFAGLLVGLMSGLVYGLVFQLVITGICLVTGGTLFGQLVKCDSVEPVEALKWPSREVVRYLLVPLAFMWIVGLPIGLVLELVLGIAYGLISTLAFLLAIGFVVGLIVGLPLGLRSARVEARTVPNQAIRKSAQNALTIGLIFGLPAGLMLFGGLMPLTRLPGKHAPYNDTLVGGLCCLIALAQIPALLLGGEAVILHFTLRYLLCRHGYLPWNLVRFLDYAAERIFLRKVGGGYIFIHRMLQDYFASLYQGQ